MLTDGIGQCIVEFILVDQHHKSCATGFVVFRLVKRKKDFLVRLPWI